MIRTHPFAPQGRKLLLGAFILLGLAILTVPAAQASTAGTTSIFASATAWVQSDKANKTFCNESQQHVRVDVKKHKTEVRRTYLYFEDVSASADSLQLQIDTSKEGGRVAIYSAAWSGGCINWNSQPGLGAYLDSKNVSGGLVTFDIPTSAIVNGSLALVVAMEDETSRGHIDFTDPTIEVGYVLEAVDDSDETDEDTSVIVRMLQNDRLGIQPTQIVGLTDGMHGKTQDNGDGTLSYVPNPDYNGVDTFTYTIGDSEGNTDSALVTITVVATNDSPTAQNDQSETDENESRRIDILANDSDPDGNLNSSSVTITRNPSLGTLDIDPATGVVTYLPSQGNCGSDSFSYTVADNEGAPSNEATVSVDIQCNEPPQANDDAATTDENTAIEINVASNDADSDGDLDLSSIRITDQPAFGTLSVHPSSGIVSYMPDPLSCGDDSFRYTIDDNDTATSNEASVVVAVLCDDPPLAIDDLYHVNEGESLNVRTPGITENDIMSPTDVITATLISDVSHGTLTLSENGSFVYTHDGSEGTNDQFTYLISSETKESNVAAVTLIVRPMNDDPVATDDEAQTAEDTPVSISALTNDSDPDGDVLSVDWVEQPSHGSAANNGESITYTPNPDFYGTDSFRYRAKDGNGGQAEATVTVLVSAVNDPPMAQDDSESTLEDMPVSIRVLGNDSDPDGDSLAIQSVTQPTNGTTTVDGDRVLYTPTDNFSGTDTFTYILTDGNGGTSSAVVSISVASTNDAPVGQNDITTIDEDSSVDLEVLANDTDVDGDALFVESVTQPLHGKAVNNGNSASYVPNPDFSGDDEFTYTLSDGNGGHATATVYITVLPVNDQPTAQNDSAGTREDTPITLNILSNDSDPDGDTLAVESTTQPDHGDVVNNGSTLVYSPDSNFSGVDSFAYTLSDGNGGTATATVTVTVTPVNDPPIAENDSASTDEESSVSISVLLNDVDPDDDNLFVEGISQPAYGTARNMGTTITYTPNTDYNGTDSFTYSVSDGRSGTDTATVTITVNPINDVPIAQDDSAITDEDTLVSIPVIANDDDPDGDFLFIEAATRPSNGSIITTETSISYIPDAGFNGIDSFTYTVSDGNGGTAVATVIVAVAAVNDPPEATDDSASTDEEMAITIPVLANDSDPDGDSLSVQSATQPSNGSVTNNGTSVTYIPDTDFNGVDAFSYTISDGNGETATAEVTIAVVAVNDTPIAQDDAASTNEDSAITIPVLDNDSDPDGDALSVQSATQPSNGSVTNNGTSVTYTPNTDFNGADAFSYTVSDGNGGTATATVSVTVKPVNDTPIAQDDSSSTNEDSAITIPVLVNDSDPDGDALSVQSATQPSHGSVINNGTSVTYTPARDFNGADSFSYTVSDGNGGTDTATISVTVKPVNDTPIAQDDAASTNEDSAITIPVLVNDSDPDGDALSVQSATQPAHGRVVNSGTSVTYTPNTDFNGADSFSYTVSDGNGGTDTATVSVTINPVNDAPVAQDDTATTDEDTSVTILVLPNDSDAEGDVLSVQSVTQPARGSLAFNASSLSYTPEADFNGVDSFSYTISDGNGGTATASVSVTVKAVNDRPIAQDDSSSTNEDSAITIPVLVNDSDPDGDALSVQSATQPTHGTVVKNGTSITYTPAADFNGVDAFSYTISDGNGGTATATVSVTVNAVNDAPDAQDDSESTSEDTAVAIDVLANDSDLDGDALSVQSTTQPAHGTVVNNGTSITYMPDADFNGVDTFSYTIVESNSSLTIIRSLTRPRLTVPVSDGNGETATATVSVTVNAVNDAPDAQDDSESTSEDTAVAIDVLANDSDLDGDALSVQSATKPAHGTVVNHGTNITYTPDGDFNGVDAFSYTISDGNGGADTATVSITVNAVNDAPVAQDDSASTQEEASVTISVLDNDSDLDGDALYVQSATQPDHGTVVNNGTSVTYTPDTDFNGVDSFSYTIADGNGGTATASVSVAVAIVNDQPIAEDDSSSTNEETAITIAVLANDTDPDGDPLSVQSAMQPTHGSVVNNGTSITYTPDADFNGIDSFSYTISDGNGGADTATVSVTVNAVNDAPAAQDDSESTSEDTAVAIDVLANDTDLDGDALSVQSATKPAHGTVVNHGTNIAYTPDADFNGVDSFSYTIADGNGGADTATVSVTVNAVNDAPAAQDDSGSTSEDTAVAIDVLANDTDLDGDPLSVRSATQPGHGTVVNNGTTVTYTPAADFNGIDAFSYTISDGNGGADTATVSVTVNAVNDAPVAQDDSASTQEDTSVTISVLDNDSDLDGDALSVQSATQPDHGTVVNNGTSVTYTPDADFNGVDSFSYTIADGNGGTATASVSVAVAIVNDPPIAEGDASSTNEETTITIDVLANDSDLDGDPLSVQSATQPGHGTVVNNGTSVTYTPVADFNGIDTFSYTISDGNGGADTATVSVTVNAVNDAPDAQDDSESTSEDTAVAIDVLANDTDLDGDLLSVQSATQPDHGTVVNHGTNITYTPDADFNGIDTFSYTISDGNGGTDTATVVISVSGINDVPLAQDDSAVTSEETAVTIAVLANDSDIDGDVLSIQSATQPAHGSVINDGANVIYTPATDFNGVDSFSYTVSDGNGGTDTANVSVTITPVNDVPIAQNDSDSTDEETPVIIPVLSNDSDPDGDTLSVQSATQPANGSVANNGTSVTYTPATDFNGVDSFTYTVSDGNGGTATATVSVAVALVNDAPVALDDSDSTQEETAATIAVLANDSDPDGDTLSVQSATQPANGSVANNSTSVTYTPATDFNGTDSFTYTVSDGNGGTATATVNITVTSVNDAPVALDDSASTPEESSAIIDVLSNDADPDGDGLSVQSVTQSSHGTVVNNGTEVIYTPDAQFNGTDLFTYVLTDGNGATSTATVTVDVTPVNDAPIAQGDSSSTNEGTPVTINVLPNDSDPDGDTLSIQSATQPANGSVVNNGTNVTYTPAPQFTGIDSFSYTISDRNGGTATATVTVAVATTNDPPTALDDEAITGEDKSVTILVLTNDSDPESDTLSVLSTSQPLHGSVVANATSIIYTPDPNYVGVDSFTYTLSDGRGGKATATIAIDVLPVNDAPLAQDDTQTMQEGGTASLLVLSNDSDPENDPLRVESISQPQSGVVTNGGSSLVYRPNLGYSGTDTFTYTIADNQGGTSTARVTILVMPLNDPPVAQDDSVTTDEDLLVVIPILANDSDPDGDFLLIESFTEPLNGSVLNSRTSLSYIPDPGFQGIDTFTYTVSDGNGGSDQATVTISVSEVNEAPIAQDDSAITDEGIAVTILPLLNDSDPDGNPLVIESVVAPENGTVSIVGSELIYTPDPQFDGVDTLTYTVSDGRGGTSTAIVFIAVAAVNDAPVAQDDSITTLADEGASIPVLNNDSDPDGDSLNILAVTQPQNGSVIVSGSDLLYKPNAGFSGTDSFTYTIVDNSGSTSTATVTVGVDPLIAGAGGAAGDVASCEGQVIISEIAWAGTAADARDEWIELRNLGTTPIDLTGWAIRWRSTHPATPEDQIWKIIELEGVLPAASKSACDSAIQDATASIRIESLDDSAWLISTNPDTSPDGYFVLERRTNKTIQDVQASQVYDSDQTLSLGLSDLGEIVMLTNASEDVVDTANASNLGRNGWVAGSLVTRGSMERIDPLKPDTADNWQTNFGLIIDGIDAARHPLRATPGRANSPDLAAVKAIASIAPMTVQAGRLLQTEFSLTRQDRRVTGWPWISVIRPGFTGISGAGGAADYTSYAFSGTHASDNQYALEIGTSNLGTGSYNFWIIYGSGQAVYIPVLVNR